jgi:predicted ester cyclase
MPALGHGAAAVKEMIVEYRKAFPDLTFTVTDAVGEGDSVAVRWVAHGTHSKALGPVSPTNRPVQVVGILMCHFRDGKIADAKVVWDAHGLYTQLA